MVSIVSKTVHTTTKATTTTTRPRPTITRHFLLFFFLLLFISNNKNNNFVVVQAFTVTRTLVHTVVRSFEKYSTKQQQQRHPHRHFTYRTPPTGYYQLYNNFWSLQYTNRPNYYDTKIDKNIQLSSSPSTTTTTTTRNTPSKTTTTTTTIPPRTGISFVRWGNTNTNTIQTKNNDSSLLSSSVWSMDTAVVTLYHPSTSITIELHAQLHYGDEEYYHYYNTPTFNNKNECTGILYELLLDQELFIEQDVILEAVKKEEKKEEDFKKNHHVDSNNNYINYNRRFIKTLVSTNPNNNNNKFIQPSNHDQDMAKQYGLVCQVNGIDYYHNTQHYQNWIHADWTRQELLVSSSSSSYDHQQEQQNSQQQSLSSSRQSSSSFGAAGEAVTALFVGPPIVLQDYQQQTSTKATFGDEPITTTNRFFQTNQQQAQQPTRRRRQRRLFTNLFVQGDSFAIVLRWLLWLTIPCPELSILLLDSSSIWLDHHDGNEEEIDEYVPSSPKKFISNVSPIILPLLRTFVQGNIQKVRKLLFGQIILTTHTLIGMNTASTSTSLQSPPPPPTTTTNNDWDRIVTQRNDKALQVLQNEIMYHTHQLTKMNNNNNDDTNSSIASSSFPSQQYYKLLYGCSHCPDLYYKLIQLGYIPTELTWRTAWSVEIDPPSPPITTPPPPTSGAITKQQQQQQQESTAPFFGTLLPEIVDSSNIIGPITVLIVFYLFIGAIDWIGTIQDVVQHLETTDYTTSSIDIISYLIRRVFLYVGLSRFIFDWKAVS